MHPASGEDLGHGVYVSPAENGRLEIVSPRLDLGWKVGRGRVPGTAVLWHDHSWEVSARTVLGAGHRWSLRTWDDSGAMRDVVPLDSEWVDGRALRAAADRRGTRNRAVTLLLLPLLGLAPAELQERWHNDWLFPAELATLVSSAMELAGGAVGVVQGLAMAFGGDWFLPPVLRFLVFVGPFMSFEGIARMALVGSGSGPAGSIVGLPFKLVGRSDAVAEAAHDPEIRHFDDAEGVVEILSPINRTDWDRDGRLPYRGRWYGLDRTDQEGRAWSYRFVRLNSENQDLRTLSLRPPKGRNFVPPRQAQPAPSVLRTTLVSAAVTLGPRADQEIWGHWLGVNPRWLTVAGAGAELIGGVVNIGRDAAAGSPLFIVLDLFLMVEGGLRLISGLGDRPMGSVFGWILRPLYRSSLPDV